MPDIVVTPGSAVIAFSGRSGITQLRSVSGVGLEFYNETLSATQFRFTDQGTTQALSAFVAARKIQNITVSVTASLYDEAYFADCTTGNITVTLPAASAQSGKFYTLKKIDSSSNTASFIRQSSNLIDGVSATTVLYQYDSIDVMSNGVSAWYIV